MNNTDKNRSPEDLSIVFKRGKVKQLECLYHELEEDISKLQRNIEKLETLKEILGYEICHLEQQIEDIIQLHKKQLKS